MVSELPSGTIPYLERRLELGDMVLFTGAGFSADAKNQTGAPIPSVRRLRELLNELVYPGTALEEGDSLKDLFGLAQTRALNRLGALLAEQFSVDRVDLPEMYSAILSAAWFRVYTVNIDDLELAVAGSAGLPRQIRSLTPTNPTQGAGDDLEVIHLNGRWDDGPANVTFSDVHYGGRYPGSDPLPHQAAVDILQRPVLFIGTELEESPLWQAIQLRKRAVGKDLRKRSFLVTPSISRSRRDYLERELHVQLLPLRLDEFYEKVFKKAAGGSKVFFDARHQKSLWEKVLDRPPLVSELSAAEPGQPCSRRIPAGAKSDLD